MPAVLKICALSSAVCLLALADDPGWKKKPIAQWNKVEAVQILTDSPWSKNVAPQWIRDLSVDERREGGNMQASQGKGIGLAGLGILGSVREAEAIRKAHEKPDPGTVLVRWESANPVQVAVKKMDEQNAPAMDDDYYAIAVHDVLTPKRWNLANELKGIAGLKRNDKKDLKPARVEILRTDDTHATVVYYFKRSAEISKRDTYVTFFAQIGRLFVSSVFNLQDMQILSQLEL